MTNAQLRRIFKALGDPTRFKVFERIASQEEIACVRLKSGLRVTPATLSHHIKELTDAGLIASRQEGKFVYLRARRPVLRGYLSRLNRLL